MDATKETMVLGGPGRSWEVLGGPRNAREAGIPGTVPPRGATGADYRPPRG